MFTEQELEQYWQDYGNRWIECYNKKLKAKCAMAAVAIGLWVEDQEGESEEAEEWVRNCLEFGLFEVRELRE
jgi:hypothetical protein